MCTNIAVVSSTDKQVFGDVLKRITDLFECYTELEIESGHCELEFCTNDPFPLQVMKALTENYQEKDLYMQIITYELNNELLEHHVYDKGVWTDKLAERTLRITK